MGLIQLSMDGPSTNWKVLDELSEDQVNSDPELPELINVSSCGYISFMEPSKEELLQLGGTLITCYDLYGICSLMHQQRRKTI